MTNNTMKFASTLGLIAVASIAAAPVTAAELPSSVSGTFNASSSLATPIIITPGIFDADAENANRYRRYRRNRVDAGDVIAGVLVLGGIVAIANAANNSSRNNRRREEETRYENRDYQPQPRSSNRSGQGLERAVSICRNEIERDVRINQVDTVNRSATGWQVTGTIYNGDRFACSINGQGQFEGVSYGNVSPAQYSTSQASDRQWQADRYTAAWDNVERQENGQVSPQQAEQSQQFQGEANDKVIRYTSEEVSQEAGNQQVAYPGGPIINGEQAETQLRGRIYQVSDTQR